MVNFNELKVPINEPKVSMEVTPPDGVTKKHKRQRQFRMRIYCFAADRLFVISAGLGQYLVLLPGNNQFFPDSMLILTYL
jgi:hypothetical protein